MPLQETSGNVSADAYAGGVAAVPNYIESVFSTYLYTGTGSTQTITNGIDLAGKGGLVWLKSRSAATNNSWFDTVRGATKSLHSNTSDASTTDSLSLTSFNANGFTLGTGGTTGDEVNVSAATYVSWTFRKQIKFFDVVTYTGTGAAQTISHNLGSVPGFIIVKPISQAGFTSYAYHTSLGNTQGIPTNSTGAAFTSINLWNNTDPTSTTFTVGAGSTNNSGQTYVAYLFANNAGGFGLTGTDNVISCGSFTTDASGNATVNLGYEPQWLMYKVSSATSNWFISDTMRGWTADGNQNRLNPNLSNAESAATGINPTATGFVVSGLSASTTFIYIAIRRGPMKVPTDGTKVFAPLALNNGFDTVNTTGFPIDLQILGYRPGGAVAGRNPAFMDRLRGVSAIPSNTSNGFPWLSSANTDAELTAASMTNGWNNTGFSTCLSLSGDNAYWNFRRAPNTFDEVCYSGSGVAANITHNLGVAPELVIVKARTGAINQNWNVCFANTGTNNLVLNDGREAFVDSTRFPTAGGVFFPTYFKVGTANGTNASGYTYVAYMWATNPGVTKVGSYTGTGATQTINCGFTGGARFVLIKRIDLNSGTGTAGDWYVWDTARGMVAGTDPSLLLDSTAAEVNANSIYTTTGGFQIVSTAADINASGSTYIFLSYA